MLYNEMIKKRYAKSGWTRWSFGITFACCKSWLHIIEYKVKHLNIN